MTERKTIQFWIAVNDYGEYCVDIDSASDARDAVGGEYIRVVEINVTIDLPEGETISVDVAAPLKTKTPAQVTVS